MYVGTAPRPGLTDHPLHTAHKMTPTKGEETADRIHGELEDLEKVCVFVVKAWTCMVSKVQA